MPRKRFKTEEIIQKLREAEVLLSQGRNVSEACRQIGVTDNTYYRWRKEYGGIRCDQAKRLKELERENARLKKLVAEAELDKSILREAASGNCRPIPRPGPAEHMVSPCGEHHKQKQDSEIAPGVLDTLECLTVGQSEPPPESTIMTCQAGMFSLLVRMSRTMAVSAGLKPISSSVS